MNSLKNNSSKSFNRIGFALFTMLVLICGAQALLVFLPEFLSAGDDTFRSSSWYIWIISFVPVYFVGIPVGILIMRKIPREQHDMTKLGGKNFFMMLLICFPIMYAGNLLGTLLSVILSGGTATNGLFDYAFDDNPLKIIVMVILAPLFEEFFFRKQLIDRCARYGEKAAIMFSALSFGLFHMNLYQFFYAFGLGLVFGYVYTRTRRLRYSVIMHMIINFIGSVIAPLLISRIGTDNLEKIAANRIDEADLLALLPAMAGFLLYVVILLGLSIAGLVILIVKARKLVILPASEELPGKELSKVIYCNVGFILFLLLCIVFFVLNLIN